MIHARVADFGDHFTGKPRAYLSVRAADLVALRPVPGKRFSVRRSWFAAGNCHLPAHRHDGLASRCAFSRKSILLRDFNVIWPVQASLSE
jgi:hypothetical protein